MSIQWFPGHMTRTKKLIRENIKKVDMIIEVIDARAPLASRNPLIDELTLDKSRLVLLNKSDLADPTITAKWADYFNKQPRVRAVSVNSKNQKSLKIVPQECKKLCKDKKWVNRRPVRAMVVGIPNVGKSTIINTLSGKKKAAASNKPGVTKSMQRVPVSREIQIFDTPGILWHKFDDQLVGLKLAAMGSIKDSVLHLENISVATVEYLSNNYPSALKSRYKLSWEQDSIPEPHEIIEQTGKNRGFLLPGGAVDYERSAILILKELRDGRLGRISLEDPDHPAEGWNVPEPPTTQEEQ